MFTYINIIVLSQSIMDRHYCELLHCLLGRQLEHQCPLGETMQWDTAQMYLRFRIRTKSSELHRDVQLAPAPSHPLKYLYQ